MLICKAYKFRLYPNKEQQAALAVQFGHARYVYNHFLALRIETYQQKREGLSYADLTARLPKLKREPDTVWLQDADSQVLQQSLKNLDRAYENYFKGRAKYPRFKSRRNKQAIRYPQRVKTDVAAKRTYLPKVGWVKTIFHRSIEGKVKNVTVSKNKSGRYYASFQVEVELETPSYQGQQAGLDLGITTFATISDGQKVGNPRYLIKAEKRLHRLQRSLSRRQKGSQGWQKQRLKVARQHEKVASQRADFQHKLSRALVADHRLIAIVDLHVKGMLRNKRLAKHISDTAWGQFTRFLSYKGAWYGCDVLSIDRWYPSSKTCSHCATRMKTMPLHIRNWECPVCGTLHDRDVNAAINILKQATAGAAERYADPVRVRPDSHSQAGTLTSEAHYFSGG